MAGLSVVVTGSADDLRPAAGAVAASAERAGVELELIVVGSGQHVDRPDARVLEVLPLGSGYARNRGLALATAPLVAFVDGDVEVGPTWVETILALLDDQRVDAVAGPVGGGALVSRWPTLRGRRLPLLSPLWRRGAANAAFRRMRLLELRGFVHDFDGHDGGGELFVRLARAGGRIVWSPALAAGARAGDRTYLAAAATLLDRVPPAIRAELPGPPLPFAQSHPAKTHFSYGCGDDRLLHLYANPSQRLRRALAERETIRSRATVGGIPRLLALAEAADAIWVVEELLPGDAPDPAAAAVWFPAVADWTVGMAGPPGRPLAETATWRGHSEDILRFAPAELRPRVARALDAVSGLRAVQMHGDLQRRNVLVAGGEVGAVDWEGAWLEGLPGLDLVFLALFAATAAPDLALLDRLAAGGDVPWGGLRGHLLRLGVADALVPDLLLAILATWALSEERRRARLGAPPAPPVFGPVFQRFAADGSRR